MSDDIFYVIIFILAVLGTSLLKRMFDKHDKFMIEINDKEKQKEEK